MEHGFSSGYEPPPSNALKIGQQHDGGEYYTAVADTADGKIPGKAQEGTCWYSYLGQQHSTEDFQFVTYPRTMITVPNNKEDHDPPLGALPIGHQTDGAGAGALYAVIAITSQGKIPGKVKAQENTCWYPYRGSEHMTDHFEWITCNRVHDPYHQKMDIDFVQQQVPPQNGLKFGWEADEAAHHWIAVAETDQGKIPGKAKDDTCWYSYNGKEHATDRFHYVVQTSPHKLVHNDGSGPPEGAIPVGDETVHSDESDGSGGVQYAVIANTDWGKIPGKADRSTAYYPYDGSEHHTGDFDWVVY